MAEMMMVTTVVLPSFHSFLLNIFKEEMKMALKLNNNGNSSGSNQPGNGGYVKQTEQKEGRKLFANKNANRALIIAGAVIGVLLIGCVILLAVPLG